VSVSDRLEVFKRPVIRLHREIHGLARIGGKRFYVVKQRRIVASGWAVDLFRSLTADFCAVGNHVRLFSKMWEAATGTDRCFRKI